MTTDKRDDTLAAMIKSLLSRLSIRLTAPVLLVLPVLLAAGVLTAISAIQGRAAVERLASQQLAQIHDQIKQHIEALVSMPARVDQANIALLESGRFDPAEPRTWGPVLVEQFRAFEALSAITWGGEDGQCTWVARYIGDDEHLYYAIKDDQTGDHIIEYHVDREGQIAPEPAGSFAFDPRIRPWYVAPKQAGRPTWSEPFLWVGGGDEEQATLGIAYGWPYFDNHGNLVGIMDADISLQDLSRYLSDLRIGRTGRAYLVDNDGLILASSTAAAVADDAGARLHADTSDEVWIEASAQYLATVFDTVGSVDVDHEEIIEIGGLREWLRASPVTHDTGLDWVIVTLVPETDFMAEIAAGRRRSAWFTVGVTLGTLGLGVLLAMLLVRPIVDLSRHLRRLGEGELDREIDLPYARELVRLSDDINQMMADLQDRVRMQHDMGLAKRIQSSLLPTKPLELPGYAIAGWNQPADQTGGDFFDWLELPGGNALLTIADATGHGIGPALIVTACRAYLRASTRADQAIENTVAQVNHLLSDDLDSGRFVTAAVGVLDPAAHRMQLFSAGHAPIFFYRAADNVVENWDADELPLGIVPYDGSSVSRVIEFAPGDVLLLTTDGFFEWVNDDNKQYGTDRLQDFLREHHGRPPAQMIEHMHADVLRFANGTSQLDDLTAVVVKRFED